MKESVPQLLKKFKSYKDSYLDHHEGFKLLSENGQNPETLIITCVDSRIDPAVLFNAALGELLVIRTKANIIPAYDPTFPREQVSAVLEFATTVLNVKNIIIMGHSQCGGIAYVMNQLQDKPSQDSYISAWLKPLLPLKKAILTNNPTETIAQLCPVCEKENTIRSFNHLKTYPWIAKKLHNKTLAIYGWYFNLRDCMIEEYDPESQIFRDAI
jgi:carbonic anhydrase